MHIFDNLSIFPVCMILLTPLHGFSCLAFCDQAHPSAPHIETVLAPFTRRALFLSLQCFERIGELPVIERHRDGRAGYGIDTAMQAYAAKVARPEKQKPQ